MDADGQSDRIRCRPPAEANDALWHLNGSRAVRPRERMNSPLDGHQVRLRGLGGPGACGVPGTCPSAAGIHRRGRPKPRPARFRAPNGASIVLRVTSRLGSSASHGTLPCLRPVGAGRHRGVIAANSFAGSGDALAPQLHLRNQSRDSDRALPPVLSPQRVLLNLPDKPGALSSRERRRAKSADTTHFGADQWILPAGKGFSAHKSARARADKILRSRANDYVSCSSARRSLGKTRLRGAGNPCLVRESPTGLDTPDAGS
jgi:hypothetical protein